MIERVPCLKFLTEFEDSIGVEFRHIRLLAKALTRRNIPYNYLTLYANFQFETIFKKTFSGHNQRLEFLGDTVLQVFLSYYSFNELVSSILEF